LPASKYSPFAPASAPVALSTRRPQHRETPLSTTAPSHLDINTVSRLRATVARLNRHLRPTSAGIAAGLTPTKATVLLYVVREGPMKLSELAEAEGLNPTMLSRVVSHLTETGLVQRSSDEGDRRAAWLTATAKGRRLAERMRRERTDALNHAVDTLTDAQRADLERALPALEQLVEALKDRPR
jgi:DNA-binding MarR family transcriptional regulator